MSGSKLCSLSIQKRTLAYLQTHSVAVSCGRSRAWREWRRAPRMETAAAYAGAVAYAEPGCFLGPLVVIPYLPPTRYLYSPKPLFLLSNRHSEHRHVSLQFCLGVTSAFTG